MDIQTLVSEAWETLKQSGYNEPPVTLITTEDNQILFVVELENNVLYVLDMRGSLFMIITAYLSLNEQGRYIARSDKLLPLIDKTLSRYPLANAVNKALLNVRKQRDTDRNKKRDLIEAIISSYHERYVYFAD